MSKLSDWILILLLLVGACSMGTPKKNVKNELSKHSVQTQIFPVSNKKEARFTLQNRLNFIKAIFEQSVDPYYGTKRWREECFQENVVGDIIEIRNGFYAKSKLTLDSNFNPGFCIAQNSNSEQLNSFTQILYFCEGDTHLTKLIMPHTASNLESLCY